MLYTAQVPVHNARVDTEAAQAIERIACHQRVAHLYSRTRHQRKFHCTIFTIDSRNQESAMMQWIFLWLHDMVADELTKSLSAPGLLSIADVSLHCWYHPLILLLMPDPLESWLFWGISYWSRRVSHQVLTWAPFTTPPSTSQASSLEEHTSKGQEEKKEVDERKIF